VLLLLAGRFNLKPLPETVENDLTVTQQSVENLKQIGRCVWLRWMDCWLCTSLKLATDLSQNKVYSSDHVYEFYRPSHALDEWQNKHCAFYFSYWPPVIVTMTENAEQ